MGFFDFVKEAGEKLFRAKDAEAASDALASAPDDEAAKARLDELNRTAAKRSRRTSIPRACR
jgi:nucleoid-associated protein YgaU